MPCTGSNTCTCTQSRAAARPRSNIRAPDVGLMLVTTGGARAISTAAM
jgi:hypothetical protein